jgi:hypothetical protein
MAKDNGSDGDREPTLRVVLRRELAIVLTDLKVRGIPKDVAAPRETWAVMAQVNGASKLNAIEAYAGKAGTPDAKPGAYRAPTAKAWAGGEEYVKPPEPKVERRSLA